jgi:hypothetical protein
MDPLAHDDRLTYSPLTQLWRYEFGDAYRSVLYTSTLLEMRNALNALEGFMQPLRENGNLRSDAQYELLDRINTCYTPFWDNRTVVQAPTEEEKQRLELWKRFDFDLALLSIAEEIAVFIGANHDGK